MVERVGGERPGLAAEHGFELAGAGLQIPGLAGVAQRHPLGPAGGTRGVGLHEDVVAAHVQRREGRSRRHQDLEVLPALCGLTDADTQLQPGLDHRGQGCGADAGLDEGRPGARIIDNEGDGLGPQAIVDRHRHDAAAHRPDDDLDVFQAVADADREALARLQAQFLQQCRHLVEAALQLAMAAPAHGLAGQFDDRHLVGPAPRLGRPQVAQIVHPYFGHPSLPAAQFRVTTSEAF